MRLVAKNLQRLDLEEGSSVDGYVVAGPPTRHGQRELICDAIGPDGEAVSLLMGPSPPVSHHRWSQFRRSARLRAGLRHDALLPVRAVGVHAGRPYLATDPYPEETFADLLNRSPLSPEDVLTLLAPVCDALDLGHASGLVHEELTSVSILVGEDGELLLDTFGVAGGPPDRSSGRPEVHDIRYSPPEELYGEALDPASNVYSVACLLVEAFGSEPGPGRRMPARAYLHLMEPSEAFDGISLGRGEALDEVIRRGLAVRREQRPGSAVELLREAAAALGVALPHADAPARTRPRRRRVSMPVVATTVVALVAGLAAGALIDPVQSNSSPAQPSAAAKAFKRLDDQRATLRARLSASDTPQEQATSATDLARAYGRAARSAASPALASSARAASAAYADLASAARAGDAGGYKHAAAAVAQSERRVTAAVRRR